MFNWLKSNPIKKMKKQYFSMLEQAMMAQRNGDIKTYSLLSADAEDLWGRIEAMERSIH